jgi:hypothetical protein
MNISVGEGRFIGHRDQEPRYGPTGWNKEKKSGTTARVSLAAVPIPLLLAKYLKIVLFNYNYFLCIEVKVINVLKMYNIFNIG